MITRGETSMEKNRIRPIKAGKSVRMSYSRQKEVLEIELEKKTERWVYLNELAEKIEKDFKKS